MPLRFRRKAGVAVLEIHGVIGTRVRVPTYARLLDAIAKSKRYRALVLDIDTPGGSASGSELLYHSLLRVKEKKPVVAYVSGMSASGGYYLCCAANKVIGLPTSIVGSIGVIYLRPILEQLLGKVGVEFSVFKGGRLKDMSGFWRGPTPEESEKFQGLINEIYDNFVSVVSQGRSMEDAAVRELATGEVVTSKNGIGLGLVDELGDFDHAVAEAARLGDARPNPMWVRPRRPFPQRLMGGAGARGAGLELLAGDLSRLLGGGIYYLEPSLMTGEYLQPGE